MMECFAQILLITQHVLNQYELMLNFLYKLANGIICRMKRFNLLLDGF